MIDIERLDGYTKGPWRLFESVKGHKTCITTADATKFDGAIAFTVIRKPMGAKTIEECEINASLIAAAPELLEEVIRLRRENEQLKTLLSGCAGDPNG